GSDGEVTGLAEAATVAIRPWRAGSVSDRNVPVADAPGSPAIRSSFDVWRVHAESHHENGDEDVLGPHEGQDGGDSAEGTQPGRDQDGDDRGRDLGQAHAQAIQIVVVVQGEPWSAGRRR